MPFIDRGARKDLDNYGRLPSSSGEKCYIFYKQMMAMWNKEPRWSTADDIYAWVQEENVFADLHRAKELAWQVFFSIHVLDYERHKQKENGDI